MRESFAVIADPHLHNVHGNYRAGRIAEECLPDGMELRTLSDTVQSTRLYNESEMNFRAVLEDIARRGVRHVIVVGDYSDDGQDESVAASLALMDDYTDRFGIRFYSTVGNHDVYGYSGRNLERDFLLADGTSFRVSGMREDVGDHLVFNPAMRCRAYADGLPHALGFFRREGDLHWETPFGLSDVLKDRQYKVASPDGHNLRSFIDASYLVEPVRGVWLLAIDANVFVPRDGEAFARAEDEFDDSTDAGYNALVKHRPYLIEWIADVASRADAQGKRLISFAHYPAVDPFDGTYEDENRLFGSTIFVRRTPHHATSAILAQAGLRLHFSGHLHIDNVSCHESLINVAVPSTAGYPGGYRLLSLHDGGADLETVRISGLETNTAILAAYRREVKYSGLDVGDLLNSTDFDHFAIRHLREVARHRFFAREWTTEAREAIGRMTLADLLREAVAPTEPPLAADMMTELGNIPAMRLMEAIYIVRHNAAWRREMPNTERRVFEALSAICMPAEAQGLAATLLRMFARHFDKEDFRHIRFDRNWRIVAKGDGRHAA
ncbi:MAG: metallophosphoesterase [Rhizobiales bacterium]|nr:metallophosphoesterase [Hyphomicrobiales bacterium]OJY04810.1 MAG: hypothetical protein BGP07_08850 [Rhizobiales bacterium 63-22]